MYKKIGNLVFCSLLQDNVIECGSVKCTPPPFPKVNEFGMLCTRIDIVYLVLTACPPGYFGELCPLSSFGKKMWWQLFSNLQ